MNRVAVAGLCNQWGMIVAGSLLGVACGGAQTEPRSAESASCPEGQSFDGEFCQVNQSVATAESDEPSGKPTSPSTKSGGGSAEKPAGAEVSANIPPEESGGGDVVAEGDLPGPEPAGEGTAEDAPGEPEEKAPTAPSFAAPIDYAMAAQAAPVMHYLASSHLPSGARPLGSAFAGQFATGQILEQKVQLQAGQCYTVVALGLPPVQELNVELFGADDDKAVATDEMKGPQAVLGSRNSCYKAKESGPAKLVLTVEAGRGLAAAQVFQK